MNAVRRLIVEARLRDLMAILPAVAVDREIVEAAGRMGREARAAGLTLPLPDLLIAATAHWPGIRRMNLWP